MASAAPQVSNAFWDLSKVLVGQVSSVLKNVNRKTQQLSAKITCHLAVTEYGGGEFDNLERILQTATNLYFPVDTSLDLDPIQHDMNLNFTLDLDDRYSVLMINDFSVCLGLKMKVTTDVYSDLEHPERKFNTKQLLQRKPSFTINKSDDTTMDDDTFEHILEVTSDHDAVMAYYYLDENNTVLLKKGNC